MRFEVIATQTGKQDLKTERKITQLGGGSQNGTEDLRVIRQRFQVKI